MPFDLAEITSFVQGENGVFRAGRVFLEFYKDNHGLLLCINTVLMCLLLLLKWNFQLFFNNYFYLSSERRWKITLVVICV